MIPPETLGTVFAASVLLGLAPGPDNIFVLTQSALHGPRAGLLVTLGLCTGLVVHTAGVSLGVAALFQASAAAFTTLKLVGAGYLLYLAWGAFRAGTSKLETVSGTPAEAHRLYLRGIVMNVTNPKVSIFFLAFLPQFADPERGALGIQLAIFGGIFMAATLLVFGSVALTAGSLGSRLRRSPGALRIMNVMAGLVFLALALKLLTAAR